MPKQPTNTATEAPSALDSIPMEDRPGAKEKRVRLARTFCVARIIDYRLQVLALQDPEDSSSPMDFADISGDAYISADREEVYQTAREHDGLLMSTAGLPGGARMAQFQDRARAIAAEAGEERAPARTERELPKATGNVSRQYTPQPKAPADDQIPY